ncbi:MAG: hypothetical protein WBW62_01205 [Solirubrobacterales bacterium]
MAIAIITVVGLVGAAGCGGGDDEGEAAPDPVETTTEPASVTKAQLITQGDGICAEVNAAVGTIAASESADETIKETQISDIYSGMADRLDELGTPSDGDAPTAVIMAAQGLAESDSTDGSDALATFQSAASEYGFIECGEAPVAPVSSGTSTGVPSDSTDSTDTYVPPTTTPEPTPPPVTTPSAPSGGATPPSSTPDTGGSGSGGSPSGGISPG